MVEACRAVKFPPANQFVSLVLWLAGRLAAACAEPQPELQYAEGSVPAPWEYWDWRLRPFSIFPARKGSRHLWAMTHHTLRVGQE